MKDEQDTSGRSRLPAVQLTTEVIQPVYGLCNRLRFMFSELVSRGECYVYWKIDEHCPGHFLDVFQEVPGVTFLDDWQGETVEGYLGDASCQDYRHLIPIPPILERVKQVVLGLPPAFSAIHVRRTDHVVNVHRWGKFTPDQVFLDAAKSFTGRFYLATDNAKTVKLFRERFEDRVVSAPPDAYDSSRKRHTDLQQAVVDIFVCRQAGAFTPTPHSSFSRLIKTLR